MKTRELIEQLNSYYSYHSIAKMVEDEKYRGFVVDDFSKLLKQLTEDLDNE